MTLKEQVDSMESAVTAHNGTPEGVFESEESAKVVGEFDSLHDAVIYTAYLSGGHYKIEKVSVAITVKD